MSRTTTLVAVAAKHGVTPLVGLASWWSRRDPDAPRQSPPTSTRRSAPAVDQARR